MFYIKKKEKSVNYWWFFALFLCIFLCRAEHCEYELKKLKK